MLFHWESEWRAGGLMSNVVCSKQNDNKLYEPRFYSEWRIRDRSLITGRGGGGLQNRKIAGPKLFAATPPPLARVKLVCAPPPF